jgi:hypothetical protein
MMSHRRLGEEAQVLRPGSTVLALYFRGAEGDAEYEHAIFGPAKASVGWRSQAGCGVVASLARSTDVRVCVCMCVCVHVVSRS